MANQHHDNGPDSADAIGAPISHSASIRYTDASGLIAEAKRIGECVLGPNAQDADRSPGPLQTNFKALADAGLLGLAVPKEYGGLDASGATQREYTELLASYCGVTTFVQAQHHGPCRMIASSGNSALKQLLLPAFAAGRMMCGISFAHLRRPGPPILRAEPTQGGVRLSGTAPWVTGWGVMNQVVFGATLPDGRFIYVWSPRQRSEFPELFAGLEPPDGEWGTLEASAPLELCAMNASATVEIAFNGWFVPQVHCLSESDRETMRRNDRNGVLGATAMPVGCTVGAVRVLRETATRRGLPAVSRACDSFETELRDVRAQLESCNAQTSEPDFFDRAVRIRAWCIELALRASHAAVTANSGAANSRNHPAQRLLREAMFYTIQAQTHEVMDATLARLERNI